MPLLSGIAHDSALDGSERLVITTGVYATVEEVATFANAPAINSQTGTSYTAVLADEVIEMTNASANTFTVPPNSDVPYPIGKTLEVWQGGAGQTTIAGGSGVTIKKGASDTYKLLEQDAGASLRQVDTDIWRLIGKMEAA